VGDLGGKRLALKQKFAWLEQITYDKTRTILRIHLDDILTEAYRENAVVDGVEKRPSPKASELLQRRFTIRGKDGSPTVEVSFGGDADQLGDH